MMNRRALVLGAVIGFVSALAPACGGPKCGSSNCNGCCDSSGKCVSKPDCGSNTTCGTAGNKCVDCAASGQTCSAETYLCTGSSVNGTDGGNCTGCRIAGGTCVPGTTEATCGSGGAACVACAQGLLCTNQQCQPPGAGRIGGACTADSDCQATLGAGAICKKTTSSGSGTYAGGYCTLRCSGSNDTVCGAGAFCVSLLPRYGEADEICWDRCSDSDSCRAPGYGCYTIGSNDGCWVAPPPSLGPPADKIGQACTQDSQCQNPPTAAGICETRDFELNRVFPGGYCSKDGCDTNSECSADGGALCIRFESSSRCLSHCPAGGSLQDATQSTCRQGYRCFSYGLADGGHSQDGFCLPPRPPPPTTVGQPCTQDSVCQQPAGTIADCVTEKGKGPDGGVVDQGFPGGYCSRLACEDDSDCGPTDAGVCLIVNATDGITACFAACGPPGSGQAGCRQGYVCTGISLSDGGASGEGYCNARCDSPGFSCGRRTCNATTGYCQ